MIALLSSRSIAFREELGGNVGVCNYSLDKAPNESENPIMASSSVSSEAAHFSGES